MARIQDYESNILPSGTISTEKASGANYGKGLQDLGTGLTKLGEGIDEYTTRQDVSLASKEQSQLDLDYFKMTAELKNPLKDEDMQKIVEDYDARGSEIRSQMQTGRSASYFEKSHATNREAFEKNLILRNARLIGEKQREDTEQLVTAQSTIAYNNTGSRVDATQAFKLGVQNIKDAVDEIANGNDALKGELVRESGAKVAVSNFQGIMQNHGGTFAEGVLASGVYDEYLSGDQKSKLMQQARSYDRAKRGEAAEDRRLRKEADDELRRKTTNDLLNMQAKNLLTVDRLVSMPELNKFPEVREHFMKTISKFDEKQQYGKAVFVDQSPTKARVFDQIVSGKINTQEELIAQSAKLKPADQAELSNYLMDKQTPEGKKQWEMKKQVFDKARNVMVSPAVGTNVDLVGTQRYNAFVSDFNQTFAKKVEGGADPVDLLDPQSKDYLVTKMIRAHAKSPSELLSTMVQSERSQMQSIGIKKVNQSLTAPLPRQPGESASDYLKRTKK